MDFNEAQDKWMAMALTGPYANYLHFTTDR